MKTRAINQKIFDQRNIINIGFLGIATVSLTQIINAPTITKPLLIATYCFAITIPLLAFDLFAAANELLISRTLQVSHRSGIRFISWLISSLGVGSLFWHVSRGTGVTFILTTLLSIWLWYRFYQKFRNAQQGLLIEMKTTILTATSEESTKVVMDTNDR